MVAEYAGLLAMFVAAFSLCAALLAVSAWLRSCADRSTRAVDSMQDADSASSGKASSARVAVDCGGEHRARPGEHVGVGFYSLAIVFLLFTLATFVFHAWGASFRESGIEGLVAMGFVASCLAVGWIYSRSRGVF